MLDQFSYFLNCPSRPPGSSAIRLRACVDGKLVQDASLRVLHKLVAGAGIDDKTGDLAIKLVNTHTEPVATDINLSGFAPTAR